MLRYCNKIYNRQSEVTSSHKGNKFKPCLTKNLFSKYFWAFVWTDRTLHVAGVNVGEFKASHPTSTLFRNAPLPLLFIRLCLMFTKTKLRYINQENALFISIRMNSTRSVIGYLHVSGTFRNSRRTAQSPSRPATLRGIMPVYILLVSFQLVGSGEGQEVDSYRTVFSSRSFTYWLSKTT